MPNNEVITATEAVRSAAAEWGAKPDTHEGRFIDGLLRLAEVLDGSVTNLSAALAGAKQLPPEVLDSFRRAARQGLDQAAQRVVLAASWRRTAAVAGAMVLSLAVGGVGGWCTAQNTTRAADTAAYGALRGALVHAGPGAEWLATVAASNNLDDLAAWCRDRAHQVAQDGGIACTAPMWIRPPVAGTQGGTQ